MKKELNFLTKKELLLTNGGKEGSDNHLQRFGKAINGFFRGLFGLEPACDCK